MSKELEAIVAEMRDMESSAWERAALHEEHGSGPAASEASHHAHELAGLIHSLSAISTQAGEGWRDIATAPKDGIEILMTNGEVVHEGHWFHDDGGTVEHRDLDGKWIGQDDSDGFDGWIDWGGGMIPAPTHWRPLPSPPSPPSDTKGESNG